MWTLRSNFRRRRVCRATFTTCWSISRRWSLISPPLSMRSWPMTTPRSRAPAGASRPTARRSAPTTSRRSGPRSTLTTNHVSTPSTLRWQRRRRPRGAPPFGERKPDMLRGEQQHQRDQHCKRSDVQDCDREPAGGQDGEDDHGLDPVGDEEPDHLARRRPEEFHASTGRRRTSETATRDATRKATTRKKMETKSSGHLAPIPSAAQKVPMAVRTMPTAYLSVFSGTLARGFRTTRPAAATTTMASRPPATA